MTDTSSRLDDSNSITPSSSTNLETNANKPNKYATANSSSLTSSKKKLLKIIDDPSESIISSDERNSSKLLNNSDILIIETQDIKTKKDTYEERQKLNKCPYLNIEVVEGTLQSARSNQTNGGAPFVKWTVRVTFANNDVHYCYKRYSEFVSLRNKVENGLQKRRNQKDIIIPELPRALPWYKALTLHDYLINNTLDSDFLMKRQQGLEYFLCYLMLDESLCEMFDESIFKHWLNIKHKEVVVNDNTNINST